MSPQGKLCSFIIIIMALGLIQGCATILHGTTQDISIATDPPGANVFVVNQLKNDTSPVNLSLDRKRNHLVEISHPGYVTQSFTVYSRTSNAVYGNIIAGGLIGWGVDALSGGQYELYPDTIFLRLTKKNVEEERNARNGKEAKRLQYKIEDAEQELDSISQAYALGKISPEQRVRLSEDVVKKSNKYRDAYMNLGSSD